MSGGWCSGFCKRYMISDQVKTNSKCLPLEDRIPRIQKFHTWLIYRLQSSGEQRCVKYCRFPPTHMFYGDQIPLPFVYGKGRSLNLVGMDCWLAQPGDGLEKRQATLHPRTRLPFLVWCSVAPGTEFVTGRSRTTRPMCVSIGKDTPGWTLSLGT